MLNTDQHNPQVKKMITEEEFIKNNMAINEGDLLREYLSEHFHSIANNEITPFRQLGRPIDMNPSRWIGQMNRSRTMKAFTSARERYV